MSNKIKRISAQLTSGEYSHLKYALNYQRSTAVESLNTTGEKIYNNLTLKLCADQPEQTRIVELTVNQLKNIYLLAMVNRHDIPECADSCDGNCIVSGARTNSDEFISLISTYLNVDELRQLNDNFNAIMNF